MRAIAPRLGELPEVHLAEDQEEYATLCVALVEFNDGSRGVVSRWRLDPEELEKLARGSDLYLLVLTHGLPMQPVHLTVGTPEWAVTPEGGS